MKPIAGLKPSGANSLAAAVDGARREAVQRLDPRRRILMGQFLTPASVAVFMASMIECNNSVIRVLDPGAGVGSLSAALVAAMCLRPRPPRAITLTAYEIDPVLIGYLQKTLDLCRATSESAGIRFEGRIVTEDFLEVGATTLAGDLFGSGQDERFDTTILNPPYRKIRADSHERKLLRKIGVETSNLYAGFLAVAARLLVPGGEMVAITPRSFCNGPYFEPFRRFFLGSMRFRRVHVFDSRDRTFADDEVLQENIVFRAERTMNRGTDVVVSSSLDPDESCVRTRTIKHDDLVRPSDPDTFIHIVPDAEGDPVRHRIGSLDARLAALGLTVSTGRVVDFRAKDFLRSRPARDTVPLIYPCHLQGGFVEWPNARARKPNALALCARTDDLLVPAEHYVLVKRFSAKEEPRRVVAAVYDPARVAAKRVAFENHLNYFHFRGSGLPPTVARGLAAYLNSTSVDSYFRQFSGHTQVNATDLRSLRYPAWSSLIELGRRIGEVFPAQEELDRLVEEVVFRG
ncbi:MAG: Eco57I restriction-modification methylase domain-containing protein [Deltaproteobacteria bacterium]|nr:Eco57I restriction-modification methylase domain-containing protein [Deltaproteobacteria bacterium]